MATITTRAGKGSPLSNSEVDANFTNLNTDKLEKSGGTMTGVLDFDSVTGRVITITGDTGLNNDDASIYLGNAPNNAGYGWDLEYQGSGSGNNNKFRLVASNYNNPKVAFSATQDGIVTFEQGVKVTGTVTVDGLSKSTANTVTASGASTTIDMSESNFHVVTMNATTTFTFSNLSSAVTASGTIILKQDATGGRTFTLPSQCKTPVGGAAIVQSTGASTTSILSYIVVSSSEVLVNYVGDFA